MMKNQNENASFENTHAFLQVNNICNQRCVFCKRPPNASSKINFNFEELKNCIRVFSTNKNISTIVFTGGETLMFPKLSELIKFAKKYNFKTEIQTNGSFLHTQINELKAAGLDKINFALHSHKKNVSNKLRGTNFGFEKINENLIMASKMGFDIHIIHVITSLNFKDLPEFIESLHQLNLNKFWLNFSLVVPESWAWENKWIIPRYKEVKPFLIKAFGLCDKYQFQFDISEIVPLCIVEGFEEHAISTNFKEADDEAIDDFITGKRNLELNPSDTKASKAPQCLECNLNDVCVGFYPRIKEHFGVSDFIPFKKDPTLILKKLNKKKSVSILRKE